MDNASGFQIQNPLSRKKLRKKLIERIPINILWMLIVGTISIITFFAIDQKPSVPAGALMLIIALPGSYLFVHFLEYWYYSAYIKRYYYDCGDQFVTIKKGVFAPTEIHVQYQKIQDVYVDQDFLDRLMGLYDVHIASATATSGIEAHIDGVEQAVAESIKNFMLGKIQGGYSQPTPPQPTNGTANLQVPQVPQAPRPSPKFISEQKVSSGTYPIIGTWTFRAVISAFFYSFFITLIIGSQIARIIADLAAKSAVAATDTGSILMYAVLFFLLIFIARIIWIMVWKSNYYFEFTPDYVLLRTGVISRSENHLPYKSIQNITNTQGVIDRMMGISTVTIENAAFVSTPQKAFDYTQAGTGRSSGIALIGQSPESAQKLNELLNQIVSSQTNSGAMGV